MSAMEQMLGLLRAQRRQYTSLSKSDGDARAARQLPVSKYLSPLQTSEGSQAIVSRVQGCRVSRNSIFWRLRARRSQPDCKPLPGEVSVQIVPHSPRCNAVPAGYRSLHDRGSHHLRLGMRLVRSYSVLHAAQHRKIRLRIGRWQVGINNGDMHYSLLLSRSIVWRVGSSRRKMWSSQNW